MLWSWRACDGDPLHGVGHVPTFSDAFPDALLDFLLAQGRS